MMMMIMIMVNVSCECVRVDRRNRGAWLGEETMTGCGFIVLRSLSFSSVAWKVYSSRMSNVHWAFARWGVSLSLSLVSARR